MPLLLLPQSGFGLPPDAYIGLANATLDDVELWMIPPDGTTGAGATRCEAETLEIRLQQAALSQHSLTVKTRLGTSICTKEYSSTAAMESQWAGWIFQLWVRGEMVFDGPIEAWEIQWAGRKAPGMTWEDPGSTVTLVALDWVPAYLRRRVVETANGDAWTYTGTRNQVAAALIRTQMMNGTVTTPDGWQTASETRDSMGLVDVSCVLPTAAGEEVTWYADAGDNVLDTVLEICNSSADEAEWIWPVATRVNDVVSFSFLRSRSGPSRGIGVDRSTDASGMLGGGPISAERGNLIAYSQTGDRTQREDHLRVTGKGRGAGQRRRYKAAAWDQATGIYEGVSQVASGGTDAELDYEAQRIVNERAVGHVQHRVQMIEVTGALWPTHFKLADTLPVYTPTGEELTRTAIGIVWTLAAPGPAKLEVDLGNWPRLAERDLGRSGGGGSGGGRGGGGRPRAKSGESDTDPDDIKTFRYVTGQNGTTATADIVDDTLDIAGYDESEVARIESHVADGPETVKLELMVPFAAAVVEANGYSLFRLDDGSGNTVQLLARYVDPTP